MNKRKSYINTCEISELKTYILNGYPQQVLIEGKRSTNPIVIFLHGGPGSPIPFCVGSRGLFPEITDNYTLVYWDQLGCGINDYLIDETFSIDSFVSMTVDLIKAIHKDYPNNSINIFGVSWGSILAARATEKVSDIINKVVVYGQVVKELMFNDEVYAQLNDSVKTPKSLEQLECLKNKSSYCQKDIMMMSKLIRKYTEGYSAKNGGKTPISKMILGILKSPDYKMKDFKAIVINGTMKNQSLHKELLSVDLTDTLAKVKVPYLIMQGSTDIVTSTKNIQALIQDADNSNLSLQIVPYSGHMPSKKGMDAVINEGFAFLK